MTLQRACDNPACEATRPAADSDCWGGHWIRVEQGGLGGYEDQVAAWDCCSWGCVVAIASAPKLMGRPR